MTKFALAIVSPLLIFVGLGDPFGSAAPEDAVSLGPVTGHETSRFSGENELIRQYCVRCHGPIIQKAELSLAGFDVATADQNAEIAEKMIRKLRAGMMPPAGQRRPDPEALTGLAEAVENRVDEVAAVNPNPGSRSFQRLNRAEYRASVLELLALDVDA